MCEFPISQDLNFLISDVPVDESFWKKKKKKEAHVLPRGRSQQDLPVVATTVDEDVPGGAVRARSTEALGGVALLQRALVLLHGQTVIGQTQLFVGCLRVQLERLAC